MPKEQEDSREAKVAFFRAIIPNEMTQTKTPKIAHFRYVTSFIYSAMLPLWGQAKVLSVTQHQFVPKIKHIHFYNHQQQQYQQHYNKCVVFSFRDVVQSTQQTGKMPDGGRTFWTKIYHEKTWKIPKKRS